MRPWLLVVTALGGCDLYFETAQQPPDASACIGGGGGAGDVTLQRDPTTGGCDYANGGACGPSAPPGPNATCEGACENLDEITCLATPGCHGAYYELFGLGPPQPTQWEFQSCWDITPLTVVDGSGACAGETAQACGVRDDCVSVLTENGVGQYAGCSPEPTPAGVCLDVECGTGTACALTCDAGGACSTLCVAGAKLGTCDSTSVTCNAAPPTCPVDTVPGVLDQCWTGFCLLQTDCT